MSGLGFARKYGLTYSTFASWVRKRRESQNQTRGEGASLDSLVEIIPVESDATDLVVELGCGSRILLANSGQVPLAAALIKTLTR